MSYIIFTYNDINSYTDLSQYGISRHFRQLRPGFHGKPFYIYKFRTMKDLRDENGNLLPMNRD